MLYDSHCAIPTNLLLLTHSLQTQPISRLQVQVKVRKKKMKRRRTASTTVKRVAQRKVAMRMTLMMKMQCLRAAKCKLTELPCCALVQLILYPFLSGL